MKIIKRTGIIKVSGDGVAREIVMRLQGVRLQKVETREIPVRYKPKALCQYLQGLILNKNLIKSVS